jgi:hypothetical protein
LIFGATILEPEAVHWNFIRASLAGILGSHFYFLVESELEPDKQLFEGKVFEKKKN